MWLVDVIENVMSSTVTGKKEEKNTDPKAERSPQSQGHCDLHPGSGPSPVQSQLGFMWLVVVPSSSKKSWLGGNFPSFRIQDLAKVVNSELHTLSPPDYQNAFES